MDKPRILYQYYDLNKKAYEIITNTPDIRTEKINKIKQFIEKGSYKVKSEKITQSVINDIFMEEMLHCQEIIFRLSISVGLPLIPRALRPNTPLPQTLALTAIKGCLSLKVRSNSANAIN